MLFLQATLTKCQIKLSQDSADSKQQTQVTVGKYYNVKY